MLLARLMLTFAMVFRRGSMRFGSIFVMLGRLLMCFFWHDVSPPFEDLAITNFLPKVIEQHLCMCR
jgi:hypothetical protein